jgi:hypothetical protein
MGISLKEKQITERTNEGKNLKKIANPQAFIIE